MNKIIKFIVLFITIFSVFLFNPFWPIWGEKYIYYLDDNRFITRLPSALFSFLSNNDYSAFQRFAAIISLICIYFSIVLTIIIIVLSFINRTRKTATILIVLSVFASLLLLIGSIVLPCSCNYKEIQFILYCLIPLFGGWLILFDGIFWFIKQRKTR